MMMQHHALTKDGMCYDAWLLPGELYSKSNYCPKFFLMYPKSSEQKSKVQLSDVVTRIANKIWYNIERRQMIHWIIADNYQGLTIKRKAQKEKLNGSAETDSRQDQGFDLAVKLRLVIELKHNPIQLIHKRLS
jgi:hypothetical protein